MDQIPCSNSHRCCLDCGVDTYEIGEMYMVHDHLWARATGFRFIFGDDVVGPGSGMLCIGCLEHRLDRRLTPDDFTAAPLNWVPLSPPGYEQSGRLQARLRIYI